MLIKFLNWVILKIGWKSIFSFFLLVMALGSVAIGLGEILRDLESGFLFYTSLIGIVLSWLLGRSKLRSWFASLALLISGIIYLIFNIGKLFGPLLAFLRAADYVTWEYLNRTPEIPIDLTNLNLAYTELYYGISTNLIVLWDWATSIYQGIPLYDEVALSIVWGFAVWSTASWAGWFMRRRNSPVLSVLPAGILITTTLAYTWSATIYLVPLLFSTLLMKALINYSLSEERWLSSGMDYPEDLPKEFGLVSVVIVIAIVGIATFLPAISISKIIETVQQFTKPQIDEAEPVFRSFGLEQNTFPREDIGKALKGGFPRGHLIGSGPELAESVFMTVNISAGIPKNIENVINLPFYWRSLTYDEYLGFGWRSGDVAIRSYRRGERVLSSESPFYHVIQQDFRMAKGESQFLYAAGEILSADSDFRIAYRPTNKYTEVLNAHGDFFGASIDSAKYRVQSLIPTISESDLRLIRGEYPDWILGRYLQLPDSVPSRVVNLAEEITQNDLTIYDKIRSIEQYLRQFEYTLDVDMPPLNRDMVDYFLFDLHSGYCDYYATSMVVMARSLGVPARLAIGYYRGSYDDVNRRYIITEADAHSWVEIYFPDIGWVPFEPTAGREEIERFGQKLNIPEEFSSVKPFRSMSPWYRRWDWNWTSITIVVLLVILIPIFIYSAIDNYRMIRYPPRKVITNLYHRLFRFGRGLKTPARKWTTPYEFSQNLQNRMRKLSRGSVFESTLYAGISEVHDFTAIYIRIIYSPTAATIRDRNQAISLWRRLRRRLWLARLRQFFSKRY